MPESSGSVAENCFPRGVWIKGNYLGGPGDGCAGIEGFGWNGLTVVNNLFGGGYNETAFRNTGGLSRWGGQFYANTYQGPPLIAEVTSTTGFDLVQLNNQDVGSASRAMFDSLRIKNSTSGGLQFRNTANTAFVDAVRMNTSDVAEFAQAGWGMTIGGGTTIRKYVSAAATWDPPRVANGQVISTTVSTSGAQVGDPVFVGHSQLTQAGAVISAQVSSYNTVTVTLLNETGSTLDVASGTVRVGVWK